MNECIRTIVPDYSLVTGKVDGKRWFKSFAELRNKTRGHGATKSQTVSEISPRLETSIKLVIENLCLFQREWAFVRMNVSGKYSIVPMTQIGTNFRGYSNLAEKLDDGVYIYFDRPRRVDLIHTTVDLDDFYFPNGQFSDKDNNFELLSYQSDKRMQLDASSYRTPITSLPASETEGLGGLDAQGNAFANLPPSPQSYISRPRLETELKKVLLNSRHPIITLSGRGGIGKTTLALSSLHELVRSEDLPFDVVVWFSARDIDLLPEGPKPVKQTVLNERDVAKDFVRFMNPVEAAGKNFDAIKYFSEALTTGPTGSTLFVFDNFETVSNPADFFEWLDTHIRLPNKLLITTRVRQFKADYPIEVGGMEESECEKLIASTCSELNITGLLTKKYHQEMLLEADGHPYVIKILLGEVAKAGKLIPIRRIVANKDDILDALFERTYNSLSPVSQRVFLTLCSWRTALPQIALEAVLLRPTNEKMDVARGIEELHTSSFIEITTSDQDEMAFITVPLVASVFGKRKLMVSPYKIAVEADIELLHYFGAAGQSDIRRGIAPRVERMFSHITQQIESGKEAIKDYLPMIEFIARQYPSAWLSLADLYQVSGTKTDFKHAQAAVNCFLEADLKEEEQRLGWVKLAQLSRRNEDHLGEAQALVEMCKLPATSFYALSDAAHRVTGLLNNNYLIIDADHKQRLVRQLADLIELRIAEANGDGCSRLAWLYVILGDPIKRDNSIVRGLKLDPKNEHCQKLATRFLR